MAVSVWLRVDLSAEEPASLQREFPDVEFFVGDTLAPEVLAEVDAVFLSRMPSDEVVDGMVRLRWIHGTMGGARAMLTPTVRQRSIAVTSSKGVAARSMSEFAVACLLSLTKRVLTCHQFQRERKVAEIAALKPELLEGSVVGVVGLGAIGSAVARKCKALGMRVEATKLHPGECPSFVDELHPPEYFPTLARFADALVFCAPPTALTEGMVDGELLRSMKPSSVLINLVTRNAILDEVATVRALTEGWIAGAAFSVFGGASAPQGESELWDLPNVIVCPGIAAYDPHKWQLQRDVFTGNLRRFLAGEAFLNLADPEA